MFAVFTVSRIFACNCLVNLLRYLDNEGTIVLGNIFSDSMEQILSNPRTQAIIEGFRNRKRVENLCRHCEYATRFNK